MKTYYVTIKHDGGTLRVRVRAKSEEAAISMVLTSEKAPRSAVVRVQEG